MDAMLQQQLFERLDAVAAKLGVAVQHLWDVFVRQAKIEAFVPASLAALCLILIGLLVVAISVFIYKARQKDLYYVPAAICVMLLIIITSCAPSHLCEALSRFYNPEYHAWREILLISR